MSPEHAKGGRDRELAEDLEALKVKTIAEHGEAAWKVVEAALVGPLPQRKTRPRAREGVPVLRSGRARGTGGAPSFADGDRHSSEPGWREWRDLDKQGMGQVSVRVRLIRRARVTCSVCGRTLSAGDEVARVRVGTRFSQQVCAGPCVVELLRRQT